MILSDFYTHMSICKMVEPMHVINDTKYLEITMHEHELMIRVILDTYVDM